MAGGKYSGDKCTLTVLRKGQVLDVETVLRVYPALSCELCCLLALTTDARQPTIPLVPRLHGFDSFASYFIVGGLVFCPLSGTQPVPVPCGVAWLSHLAHVIPVPFLHGWYGGNWQAKTPSSLLWHYSHGLPSPVRTPTSSR